MRYYQEITIIKSPDISPYFIWSKLYTQLHLALVESLDENHTSRIGVSFPEYQCVKTDRKTSKTLGTKLRVFAHTEQELTTLNLSQWFARLLDYVHIKSIQPVPEGITQYLIVNRLRQKSNNERLTRAYAKKHQLSFEEAKAQRVQFFIDKHQVTEKEALEHYDNPKLKERPFIKIQSLHQNLQYSLEIEQRCIETEVHGVFNSYGLSGTATVPKW